LAAIKESIAISKIFVYFSAPLFVTVPQSLLQLVSTSTGSTRLVVTGWSDPSGKLSRHFGPSLVRGAGPHHHVEAARRWCSCSSFRSPTVTHRTNITQLVANTPEQHSPLHMFPARWSRSLQRLRHARYSSWRRKSFSQLPLLPNTFGFLKGLTLPRLVRCELSRFLCHGHSLLLFSYLCRIKWKENSSCSASARSNSPSSGLSRI